MEWKFLFLPILVIVLYNVVKDFIKLYKEINSTK